MISDKPVFLPYTINESELKKALIKAYRRFAFRPHYIKNKVKDIYYSPKKLIPYIQGTFSLARK
jgi:hypothetical protein